VTALYQKGARTRTIGAAHFQPLSATDVDHTQRTPSASLLVLRRDAIFSRRPDRDLYCGQYGAMANHDLSSASA
jgi:hypothetical protein